MCPDKNQCISAKLLKLKGFKIQHKIGSGSFSTVYKALTDNEQHTEVAIKCIDKTKVSENRFDSIVNEIKALKLLHHQHIVTMLDFLWDERYVYIILEYCDGGDLCSFIRSHEKLSEFQCQQFVRQLVLALKFLRENNVCHFDLKPQNILIKNNTLKLADFGFAQFLAPNDQGDSIQGSPLYMAPEILAGSPYNAKADLWSLGVLVFEALFGHAPYASCNLSQLRAQALSSAPITIPPNSLSPDCMDFLSRLLQKDPMRRISYEDLFSHPYPDLIHAPCAESHQTAICIVTDAIHHDRENNSRRAFSLYCEALNYLIPLAYGEADATRKKELYSKVEEYRRRAQQLASKHQPLPVITTNSTHSHTSLHVLAEAIPNLKSGLEIGETGDMYLAEGNYELALEKLKASLAILIQFCEAETSSSQLKPLLAHQIEAWLSKAEHLQTMVEASRLQIEQLNATAVHTKCCLQ